MTRKTGATIILLLLLLAGVFTLTACNHTHQYGEWSVTKAATCVAAGEEARYCSCGDTQTRAIAIKGHSYGEWTITKAVTCTEAGEEARYCSCGKTETRDIVASHNWVEANCESPKTCTICNKTEGVSLGHNYKNGQCTICNNKLEPKINIPSLPINLTYIRLKSNHIYSKCTITSVTYDVEWNSDGTFNVTFYFAGQKTYDEDGDSVYNEAFFNYKLCDSEGYSVQTSYSCTPEVQVGEKFKDYRLATVYDLDPNQEYTLYLLDKEI